MKAHLDYHSACREYLQRMRMQCAPAPGTGSVEDSQRAEQHDRLLPPLYVDKDLMVYLPMEEISLTMTRRLYNYLLENLETLRPTSAGEFANWPCHGRDSVILSTFLPVPCHMRTRNSLALTTARFRTCCTTCAARVLARFWPSIASHAAKTWMHSSQSVWT